jgi:hypothetical protein
MNNIMAVWLTGPVRIDPLFPAKDTFQGLWGFGLRLHNFVLETFFLLTFADNGVNTP